MAVLMIKLGYTLISFVRIPSPLHSLAGLQHLSCSYGTSSPISENH